MLNELDLLSQNIGRLIAICGRFHQARHDLEQQLVQARAAYDEARAELERVRRERDGLCAERDAFAEKIDHAQVQLNAILEKLPRGPLASSNAMSAELAEARDDVSEGEAHER